VAGPLSSRRKPDRLVFPPLRRCQCSQSSLQPERGRLSCLCLISTQAQTLVETLQQAQVPLGPSQLDNRLWQAFELESRGEPHACQFLTCCVNLGGSLPLSKLLQLMSLAWHALIYTSPLSKKESICLAQRFPACDMGIPQSSLQGSAAV
jgi:hypothetical protein